MADLTPEQQERLQKLENLLAWCESDTPGPVFALLGVFETPLIFGLREEAETFIAKAGRYVGTIVVTTMIGKDFGRLNVTEGA